MPRTVDYNSQSIIYFEGDVSDKIFVLKSGEVAIHYRDIESGKDAREVIQRGEFFGVKSALGRYPREERVTAVTNCSVLIFSVEEFESFAMENSRVVMKMLKVFSNQLRRIHTKVRTLLSVDGQVSQQEGLLRIAKYFKEARRFKQAVYAYQRYLELYPQGNFVSEAQEGVSECKRRLGTSGSRSASSKESIATSNDTVDAAPGTNAGDGSVSNSTGNSDQEGIMQSGQEGTL